MTTTFRPESARIYQFPLRPAAARSNRGSGKPASETALQRVPDAGFSGSWYHEAAIQAERERKS